jgi:hypothetical protein
MFSKALDPFGWRRLHGTACARARFKEFDAA